MCGVCARAAKKQKSPSLVGKYFSAYPAFEADQAKVAQWTALFAPGNAEVAGMLGVVA